MPDGIENTPQLNHLTLWLNYEKKLDDLRGHFPIFAGLLFTLQSGIFTLMLDKIFLSDKHSSEHSLAERFLIILSIFTGIFLFFIAYHYNKHIKNNIKRSKFSEGQDPNITEFKKRQDRYVYDKKYNEKESGDS